MYKSIFRRGPAPRGGQQAGCGVAPGGRWALAGGAGSSSFPHSGRVRERPDRHAPETADGLVTWCPEGCPPCSPVLCGSWRGCRLGSVASDHRVGPQTAFLKGHGQSLSWLYAEEVSEAALDRQKDCLGDPCTPRVADGGSGSEFVLQHQTAPSVLRSDTTIPALGFHFPSLPHKRGHGQGQADTQWGGSLGGKCPSQQGFLLPPSDGPGSPSQLSVSLRGHLARTFSRAPKGHAAPARVNAVVSPEATAGDGGGSSGRRRAPEMPWVVGIRSDGGTWARLPGP